MYIMVKSVHPFVIAGAAINEVSKPLTLSPELLFVGSESRRSQSLHEQAIFQRTGQLKLSASPKAHNLRKKSVTEFRHDACDWSRALTHPDPTSLSFSSLHVFHHHPRCSRE